MRVLFFVLLSVLLIGCSGTSESSKEETLMGDAWKLVSIENDTKRIKSGLKFSTDYQVFELDSQGMIIPPIHERIFSVNEDTLTIVDYKFVEEVRHEKGTDIFIIEELTKDKLVVTAIYPEEPNKMVFERLQ